jgi:peptidoglycan hydrolase CwlO-like protein
MKRTFAILIFSVGLILAAPAAQTGTGGADEIASKRAQLEKDKASLDGQKNELKKLQAQVDDLKKKVKLQEDNVKMQEKRIQNLQKLNKLN